jgi:hypothetical protein
LPYKDIGLQKPGGSMFFPEVSKKNLQSILFKSFFANLSAP